MLWKKQLGMRACTEEEVRKVMTLNYLNTDESNYETESDNEECQQSQAFNLGEVKSSMQSCTQDKAFHKFSEVYSS